jgi:hypothetical protein
LFFCVYFLVILCLQESLPQSEIVFEQQQQSLVDFLM